MVLLRTFHLDYCPKNLQKTTHLNKKNLPSDPQHAHLEGPLPQEGPNHIGSVRDYHILPSLYWKPQFSRWSEMGVSRIRTLEGSYQSLQLERFPI